MKKSLLTFFIFIYAAGQLWAATPFTDVYTTSVTFSAGYSIGDYVEFVKVAPLDAGSSGYYEVSISYTREGVAAAATHLASVSHANPVVWREAGRVNNNPYAGLYTNFTVDLNTDYTAPRFRIRATGSQGSLDRDLVVNIKIQSINQNGTFTAIHQTGNDLSVSSFNPMTSDWSLYVGNSFSTQGAALAMKVLQNGNVGIGTVSPAEKLSVNGNIRAKEIKVETANWPDYVFRTEYDQMSLSDVEKYIAKNGHLPSIPSAAEAEKNGVELGEMNRKLLEKVEELTLYLIELKKENINQNKDIRELKELLKKKDQ